MVGTSMFRKYTFSGGKGLLEFTMPESGALWLATQPPTPGE